MMDDEVMVGQMEMPLSAPDAGVDANAPLEAEAEARLEAEREALLTKVAAASFDDIQSRVAWLLNTYPETRDSDVTLQILYWQTFEDQLLHGDFIRLHDMYTATRLTTLTRARATIQNKFKLFLASPAVRARRGTMSDEERQKAAEQTPPAPVLNVYADESGKQGPHLIVASVWFLHGRDIVTLTNAINAWRAASKWTQEVHFKALEESNDARYREFGELFLNTALTVSFKAITVQRAGVARVPDAFEDLFYHLLARGVEHEHDTGRAVMPRFLHLTKDAEEVGADRLMFGNLEDRLRQRSTASWAGQVHVESFVALESTNQPLLQMADLVAASLNRVLNVPPGKPSVKDAFARWLLHCVGMPAGPATPEHVGDMSVCLTV